MSNTIFKTTFLYKPVDESLAYFVHTPYMTTSTLSQLDGYGVCLAKSQSRL